MMTEREMKVHNAGVHQRAAAEYAEKALELRLTGFDVPRHLRKRCILNSMVAAIFAAEARKLMGIE
jgi:hypothetical protein